MHEHEHTHTYTIFVTRLTLSTLDLLLLSLDSCQPRRDKEGVRPRPPLGFSSFRRDRSPESEPCALPFPFPSDFAFPVRSRDGDLDGDELLLPLLLLLLLYCLFSSGYLAFFFVFFFVSGRPLSDVSTLPEPRRRAKVSLGSSSRSSSRPSPLASICWGVFYCYIALGTGPRASLIVVARSRSSSDLLTCKRKTPDKYMEAHSWQIFSLWYKIEYQSLNQSYSQLAYFLQCACLLVVCSSTRDGSTCSHQYHLYCCTKVYSYSKAGGDEAHPIVNPQSSSCTIRQQFADIKT